MSKVSLEDYRILLKLVGGETSVSDLEEIVDNLHLSEVYSGLVSGLHKLEARGVANSKSPEIWQLVENAREESLPVMLDEIEEDEILLSMRQIGLDISNIVATLDLNREIDLEELAHSMQESEYEPEHSPFLLVRPLEESSATVLMPANGVVSIVGTKSVNELQQAVDDWLRKLNSVGLNISKGPGDIQIRNIVVRGDLEREFDLDMLVIGIGLERCEYEPEQFPGVIYRTPSDATILVFRSGKYIITGITSYSQALLARSLLTDELEGMGIDLENRVKS